MPSIHAGFGAARFGSVVLPATLFVLWGCSQFQPHRSVPAPAGAIAAAPLDSRHVAVLAGNDRAKGIFVIDLGTGEIVRSFGVTKEATGISADGDAQHVLVSVGRVSNRRSFGAVELWSLDGVKQRIAPMPAAALGITRNVDGISYVLLGGRESARAALPVQSGSLVVGKALPLDSGAHTLQQCKIGDLDYLLYTDGDHGVVTVRAIDTGAIVRSSVVAESPECGDAGDLFAISKGFATRSIAVLRVPSLEQVASIPASNAATTLYQLGDHRLIALNATARVSDLEVFPEPTARKTATR